MPFSLTKTTLTTTTTKNKLTLRNLTNTSVPVSPTCTLQATKHAPFAINVQLVHESRVVFTAWLPLSAFANIQRSFTHPGPIPGLFLLNQYSIDCHILSYFAFESRRWWNSILLRFQWKLSPLLGFGTCSCSSARRIFLPKLCTNSF